MTSQRKFKSAADAFIVEKAKIDAILTRLVEHSENHFDVMPDDVNWGHVGDLAETLRQLKQISDATFREGEHAD